MKKLAIACVMFSVSTATMAEAPGGPDCGWGNMLLSGKSGLVPHLGATITNGTSGNATFGMTSGTNGCSVDGNLTYGGESLVHNLMDELVEDVARGDGEALNAVAALLGVDKTDRGLFASVSHQNFDNIFPHENVTAEEVITAMKAMIKSHPQLDKYSA